MALTLFLGLAHASGASVPCGAHGAGVLSGCDKVAQDDWSRVFGIPVAFAGFLMYLSVSSLCFLREVVGLNNSPRLSLAIWLILAAAAVVAGMMLGRTYFVIQASCMWCLASHSITFAMLVLYTLGIQSKPKEDAPAPRRFHWLTFPALMLLGILAGGGPGYRLYYTQRKTLAGGNFELKTDAKLVREYSPILGNPEAKTTVIEFSDLHCPVCKHWHTFVEEKIRGRFAGKVRLVFRNFPVAELHPLATLAAVYGEYARRNGKFWEFASANFSRQEGITKEVLDDILDQLGLSSADAAAIVNDGAKLKDHLKNVHQDMEDGFKLGVRQTPWWFIIYPNQDIEFAIGGGIADRFDSRKFLTAVGGD